VPEQVGKALHDSKTETETLASFSCGIVELMDGRKFTPTGSAKSLMKATLIYRRTGNLCAVQLLLGHTGQNVPFAYLGVEVDDEVQNTRSMHG
jgi:hypothetical protein